MKGSLQQNNSAAAKGPRHIKRRAALALLGHIRVIGERLSKIDASYEETIAGVTTATNGLSADAAAKIASATNSVASGIRAQHRSLEIARLRAVAKELEEIGSVLRIEIEALANDLEERTEGSFDP